MSTAAIAERMSAAPEALRAKFTAALVAASAIVALSVGRAVFVPLSLAVLIAFALAPVTDGLRKLSLSRMWSVLATIALAALAVAGIALFLGAQFAELAAQAPAPHAKPALPMLAAINEPMPVWIASYLAEPLMNPMTSAGIAVLFAAFLLLQKEELAERFSRFAASRDAVHGGNAIEEAGRAFGRHLLSQGVMDLSFGTLIALGLWFLGVPNFGLWALLGVMLRSVPFVGVPVAALCPLMLAVSIDPSALLVCETLLLYLGVDGALQLIARKLVKRRAPRLSAIAAIGATIAWTCLWGITGLLLAMPLTLGLVAIARNFGSLGFLEHLLAGKSDAPLPFARRDKALARGDAAIRALATAQRELAGVAPEKCRRVVDDTVSRLAPAILAPDNGAALALRPWNLAPGWQDEPVLCIAGPGIMDEAAAGLLAEALKRKGLKSRVVGFEAALPANLPGLDFAGVQAVCVSCLDARDTPLLRQLVRRLRPKSRHAKLIAGLWGWDGAALMDVGNAECDLVTTHLNEAAERIARLARAAEIAQPEPGALDFAPAAVAVAA